MFNLMKLGLHFSQMNFGVLDPMVLELIRTERLMNRAAENRAAGAEHVAANDEVNDEKSQEAA